MAIKDFQILDSPEKDLVKVQQNLTKYFNQLNQTVLDGRFLETINQSGREIDITIGTSTTLVPHGLGRKLQGWSVFDIHGSATVWRDTTSGSDPSKFLALKASGSVTIKLWVF